MSFNKKKIRPDYDKLTVYIPHALVVQINEIVEMGEESFDEVFIKIVRSGADVWAVNFILKNERLKIDRLNSMLTQIYGLMNIDFVQIDPVITMKFVQIHSLSSPVLYKNNPLFSKRQKELISTQIHKIYKYGHNNFLEEFNKFKAWVFGNSRTQMTKELFKFNGKNSTDDIYIIDTVDTKEGVKGGIEETVINWR